jgi:anthranilate 1,2-dioxygenase small subunit
MNHDLMLRLQVESFLYDYAAALDEERFAEWPDLFSAADCRYEVLSRENVDLGLPVPIMSCYSHGMVRDRVAMLVQGTLTYRKMHLLRQVSNVRAQAENDGTILARAGLTVFQSDEEGVSSLYIVGRYEARLVQSAGSFSIQQMKVVVDSFGIDTMLAVPL